MNTINRRYYCCECGKRVTLTAIMRIPQKRDHRKFYHYHLNCYRKLIEKERGP